VDDIFEETLTYFIFDADNYTIEKSFRGFLTINDITRIVEGEYE
jgi:hypothetical protein